MPPEGGAATLVKGLLLTKPRHLRPGFRGRARALRPAQDAGQGVSASSSGAPRVVGRVAASVDSTCWMSVALPSPRVVTVGTLDTLSLVGLRCVRRFRLGLGLGEEEEEPTWQV